MPVLRPSLVIFMAHTGRCFGRCCHCTGRSRWFSFAMDATPPFGTMYGMLEDSMADRFPELYSHCSNPEITVQQVLHGGLSGSLIARLSPVATEQLDQVTQIAAQQSTTGDQDRRKSPLLRSDGDLDTSAIYSALKTADATPDPWSKFVWKNKAPPRVKFFAWLLSKSRIQCKKNLAR